MIVSYLPEPEKHPLWEDIKVLLEPATEGAPTPEGELVWIIYDGPVLYAAATTVLCDDGTARLRLAGGYRHKLWAEQLSEVVSAWARDCGATRLTGRGRKGWARYARAFGWDALDEEDGRLNFEKVLR